MSDSKITTSPTSSPHKKEQTPAAPTNARTPSSTPDTNHETELRNASAAPVTVDELLKLLLYFRQFDHKQINEIESYLVMTPSQLRWLAPDVDTLMQALNLSSAEKAILGNDVSTTKLHHAVELRKKIFRPKAEMIVKTVSTLINLIETMHSLFPSMSEEDFHQEVFLAKGEGLKDLVEALTESHPVASPSEKAKQGKKKGKTKKTPKLSQTAQAKAKLKPITNNPRSRLILKAFVDLLMEHGNRQNSNPAKDFAKRLSDQLKLEEDS